jgi:hypothetical protein
MHRALRLTIDSKALQSNWRWLAAQSGTACGAAVKANGYGLGAQHATKALAEAGCRDFFVSTWAEAAELGAMPPGDYEMKMAVSLGRTTRPGMEIGICGEHGGDPKSVAFCHAIGLDYVSCSPFRIPIARLAAAQAVLRERGVEASALQQRGVRQGGD